MSYDPFYVSGVGQGLSAAAECTGCYGLLGASVVLTPKGGIGEPGPTPAITRAADCLRFSMTPSNTRIPYSICQDPDLLEAMLSDGGNFNGYGSSKVFIDAYTSIGQIMYDGYCIGVTQRFPLETPITIGASDAYLTTYIISSTTTGVSGEASRVGETPATATDLVINSDIVRSMEFSCTSPIAYLLAATSSPTSFPLASSLVLKQDLPNEYASRIISAIVLGISGCIWLGFICFFIFWRRSRNQHHKQVHSATLYEGKPVGDTSHDRGSYSRIPRKPVPATTPVHRASQNHRLWKAPSIMVCGLLCGLAFAIGHHFLYHSINGQPVNSLQTPQTWFLRLGNLLAILVKLSFVVSIGIAFVQLQWMKLHQVALSVRDIDALSGVLSNVLSFFDGSVWLHFPSLLILASIFWLTSLVPIFTPGTLNTELLLFQNTTYVQVPQIDFSNATRWLAQAGGLNGATSIWEGAVPIRQVSMAASVGGQVIPIPSSYANNGTYVLNFHGPALKCYNASTDVQNAFTYGFEKAISDNPLYFLYTSTVDLPVMLGPGNSSKVVTEFPNFLDSTSLDYSRIYIRTRDPPLDDPSYGSNSNTEHTFSVTECGLYNAAYSVQFTFQGFGQETSVLDLHYLEGVSLKQIQSLFFDGATSRDFDSFLDAINRRASYCGLLAGLGSVLVGSLTYLSEVGNFVPEFTSAELLNFDYFGLSSQEVQSKTEDLFQNMTLSMFSRPDFYKNFNDAEWIAVVNNVSLSSYIYDSRDLVITYGLSFIATQICVLFGLFAVTKNRGTYQNQYSTFLRATKNESELRKYNNDDDTALDPRPKALADATVNIVGSHRSRGGIADSSTQDTRQTTIRLRGKSHALRNP